MSVHGANRDTLKKVINEYQLDETKLNNNRETYYEENKMRLNKGAIPIEEIIFEGKHPLFSTKHLANRLVKEGYKEYKCERCGVSSWQGKPLTLQLHHKDENKRNHNLENLELLCPNCHSQTEGYAGRKVKMKYVNGVYKKVNVYKKTTCPICGKEMSVSAKNMCMECYRKEQAKNIPPKEELEKLIYDTPFTTIAKQYGVSDKAVSKWCKKYDLPFRKKDIREQNNSNQ